MTAPTVDDATKAPDAAARAVDAPADVPRRPAQRLRDAVAQRLLARRRSRAKKKRGPGRRTQVVLTLALLLLLGLYAWTWLSYLPYDPRGRELTLDQLSVLADEKRLVSASFLDEDNIITGEFAAPVVVEEREEQKGNKGDQAGKPDGKEANGKSGGGAASPKQRGDGKGKAEQGGGDGGSGDGSAASPSPTPTPEREPVAPDGAGTYWAAYPNTDAVTPVLTSMAIDAGATVDIHPQTFKQAARMAATFLLPLMILANLFALLFSASRGGGSGIGEVMMFGTIAKKGYKKGRASSVSFSDVAGAEEAVAELKEVKDYLQNPKKYADVGAAPPKGVLLVGPPGCGKTLLAKAVAGEAGVPFFSVAGAEFVESLVGVGAARVRDLFARVRAVAPAILFIDELDAAGRRRGAGGGSGGSDEREQTLNQMLVEMDGFEISQGIVVIAATNRPDILDPALLRPGRFDRHVTMDLPDQIGRQEILELHARGKPIAPDVDFEYLARRTPGFSGADLANVINEAALLSLREAKPQIEMSELEEAVLRVMAGPKKKGRVMSDEERQRAAYHESGHAIVSAALGRADEVHRVSILARGRGLGLSQLRRETEAILLTRSDLFAQIVAAFGGRAAEIMMLGQPSTGAEEDLERATEVALEMVGRFGMGTKRQRLLGKDVDHFLGADVGFSQLSPNTQEQAEEEVEALLGAAESEATRLLELNRELLDDLAARLLEVEHLEGALLEELLVDVNVDRAVVDGSTGGLGNGQVPDGQVGDGRRAKKTATT